MIRDSESDALRGQMEHRLLDLLPRLSARIDQIEVPRVGNLEQMRIFLLLASAFLFGSNIIPAKSRRNNVVAGTMNQPLPCLSNCKLHRVSFAVVIGHFVGSAAQK